MVESNSRGRRPARLELFGESDCCLVGNLELHGDNRRDPLLHEGLRDAGKGSTREARDPSQALSTTRRNER